MATPCDCDTLVGNIVLDSSGAAGQYVRVVSNPGIAGQGALRLDQGSANYFTLWTEDTGQADASVLYLGFDGTDAASDARLTITGAGNVGLGTTSPTQLLHLQGGSLYINGGNILVSGDVTTGVGAFYAVTTKVADAGGCYYGN